MPSVLLTESLAVELGGKEPWPGDVQLFQPNRGEQILLPDMANCLAAQTFLTMAGLHHEVVEQHNAEDMSPNGKVPFLKCGSMLVSELDRIISLVHSKGISLSNDLEGEDRADMRAFIALINNVLNKAELYLTWVDPLIYQEVTYPRSLYRLPRPVAWLIVSLKRREMVKKLDSMGWASKHADQVYEEVDRCFQSLSIRLGHEKYFFDKPTELDALLFGHLFTILTTELPDPKLMGCVKKHANLVKFCERIEQIYFPPVSPDLREEDSYTILTPPL